MSNVKPIVRMLFLDDDDVRHAWWAQKYSAPNFVRVHAHDIDEYVSALADDIPFDVVFLDHDLNDHMYRSMRRNEQGSITDFNGYDAARLLTVLEPERRPKHVRIHSWNPVGARRMFWALTKAGIPASVRRFNVEEYFKLSRKLRDEGKFSPNYIDHWAMRRYYDDWDGTGSYD